MFIVVDGIDGAGKSTLVLQLAELLGSINPEVTKEPTDHSKWGKRLRAAAVEGRLPHDKELEYFRKDRLHHIDRVIKPALEKGAAENVTIAEFCEEALQRNFGQQWYSEFKREIGR